MLRRVLARGDLQFLYTHLLDLAAQGVVFTGLQELRVEESLDCQDFTLAYKYMFSEGSENACPQERQCSRTIYLLVGLGCEGITFEESLNSNGFQATRCKVPVKKARKTTIKVKLEPLDLRDQIHAVADRVYNQESWNSE